MRQGRWTGLLGLACVGERLRVTPFRCIVKTAALAPRAETAATVTRQRRLLRKADKGLVRTDRAVTKWVGSACGDGIGDRVARHHALLGAVLAALQTLAVSPPGS